MNSSDRTTNGRALSSEARALEEAVRSPALSWPPFFASFALQNFPTRRVSGPKNDRIFYSTLRRRGVLAKLRADRRKVPSRHAKCFSKAVLTISGLPKFTILRDRAREELILSGCGGKIQWLSERIAQRFPTEKRIGIIYPTSSQLILLWLAALKANKEPCMLQYPTEKLAKDYWRDLVRHTVENSGLEGLIHGPELASYHPKEFAPCLVVKPEIGEAAVQDEVITDGAIVQLSSGTTGYKKGVRLTLAQLRRHAENYNQVMQLGPEDTIVSWLPLYHDMGFIACFVMPLMLRVPVVMIDPMTWVKHPEMLFAAIAEYRGTVCYLPNFGFEVMSRQSPPAALSTMRHWISCSEPTHVETLERFCARSGTNAEKVSTCYGMAENVFAVAQSRGLKTFESGGRRLVSCGKPIPGTEVKLVDGELHVRSDTSLQAYIGTQDVRDAEGFYATGDLGSIVDGEIVVSGRKRDVMISAGKKYLLSDLDYAVGRILPESAGRIASLAVHNQNLGTETVTFLVEHARFWETKDLAAISKAIKQETCLDAFEVYRVPPCFLTKTSSGKINRVKTLQDWKTYQEAKARAHHGPSKGEDRGARLAEQIAESFPTLPRDLPLGEVLDSLGVVLIRLICEDHAVEYDPKASVNDLLARAHCPTPEGDAKLFSIVALVDGIKLGFGAKGGFNDPAFLSRLEKEVGAPVQIEHICAPPAPILLSDIIFHDYFMPRDPGEKYGPFSALVRKIKNASLVLIDDEDAFRVREVCVYPRLSHRFNSAPESGLLGHRLQRYTRNHHLLACEAVAGRDISLETITGTMDQLSAYLDTPVMKLAFHPRFKAYTREWDYTQYRPYISDADYETNPINFASLQSAILEFVRRRKAKIRYTSGSVDKPFVLKDPPHFCSFLLRREAVDYIANRYASFCIAGLPSSLPYLERRLKELGKPYFHATTLNPARSDFECLVATGFSGEVKGDKPYFDFLQVGGEGGKPHNVLPEVERECPHLVAGDPQLIDVFRARAGNVMPVGNYVMNIEERLRTVFAAADHCGRGRELMARKRFAEAAVELRQCLVKCDAGAAQIPGVTPLGGAPLHYLALCLAELKDSKGAAAAFRKALLEEPRSQPIRLDYARFLAAQHQTVEALKLFYQLVEENTGDMAAWFAGGQTLLSKPELLDAALKWTLGGLQIHPNNPYMAWQRAEALTLAGHFKEAIPLWRALRSASQPSMLAALVLCETLAGETPTPLPAGLEEAVGREFSNWRQRLTTYGAKAAVAELNQRLASLQAIHPTIVAFLAPGPKQTVPAYR
jgi:acyl-CoA synthetase (AMP-forming)/AMP-acid ligase II/tetratricopeptide (TPR) repeat protein